MVTKIILPVIDTERGKFEYNGRELTAQEYGNMEYEHFRKTNSQVSRFVDNIRHGISNVNPYGNRLRDVDYTQHPDIFYNDEEVQAVIMDSSKKEIDESFLLSHAEKGDMFLLVIDINPNTATGDGESELRFWVDDSNKVVNDRWLSDEVKLKSLPGRDYGVVCGDKIVTITNCKMVQSYATKNHPFYFAIIVEKAIL